MGIQEVQDKINRNEKLTDEDKREVMSEPMPGGNKASILLTDEDVTEGEAAIDRLKAGKEAVKEEAGKDGKEKEVQEEGQKVTEQAKEEPKKEAPITEDAYKRIDIELAKPEGQVNLADFSEREKAFYFRMRREQRRAQKAEEERDALRFDKAKEKAQVIAKEEKAPEVEDPLKDREADDFLTVGDVRKMMQAAQKKAPEGPNPEVQYFRSLYLKKCEERAQEKHADYAEVIELAEDVISADPVTMRKLQDATLRGDDPAETAYQIIKGDPRFEELLPVAQARLAAKGVVPKKQEEPKKETPPAVSPEVKKVEEKLREEKPRTSVHAGAAESGERELTAEHVASMTTAEYHRLSKDKREALLRRYGV